MSTERNPVGPGEKRLMAYLDPQIANFKEENGSDPLSSMEDQVAP